MQELCVIILYMTQVESLLEDYLNYLEVQKNYSPKTRENYERYLKSFIKSEKIKSVGGITLNVVNNFRLTLARQKNPAGDYLKKSTQSYYIIAIRNFLKHLIKKDFHTLSPEKVELPKMGARQIDIIQYGDLERLLKGPTKKNGLKSLRDKAILEVLFSTGLRISELCSLDRYIDIERGEIPIRGKGNKLRVVFLSEGAKKSIKNYLEKRGDADPSLFISLNKAKIPKVIGRITPRAVQRLVNFWSRKSGLGKRITPHQLRHQFATDLLMNGADLRSVQELLGHANVATTQVYTHITNQGLQEVHKSFHGRRRNR